MLLQQVVSGIAIGSIYALIALGFVLIYKASEIVNFAHGDMIMFIAFCAYTFLVQYKMNYFLSFVLTIFCGGLLGILLQRIIVSPLIRAPVISVVIATLAISIILRNLAGLIWTHEIVFFPSGFSEKPVNFSGLVVAQSHIWFIVISLALMSLLFLFFKFTKIGTP